MDQSFYDAKDFTREKINQWLAVFMDDARPEVFLFVILPSEEQASATGVTATELAERIFVNTLEKFLLQNPDVFINAMYTIAEEGLDPDDATKQAATTRVLRHGFDNVPLALATLYSATVCGDPAIRQKSIDVRQTLLLIDPHISGFILDNARLAQASEKLSDAQLKPLVGVWNKYLKLKGRMMSEEGMKELDRKQAENIERFTRWAASTPEGAASTLYARFQTGQ